MLDIAVTYYASVNEGTPYRVLGHATLAGCACHANSFKGLRQVEVVQMPLAADLYSLSVCDNRVQPFTLV